MIKKLALTAVLAAVAALAPVTSSEAATEPFGRVQIASRPAILHADGSVDVVMWARCKPGIQAFELDTSVVQPSFGVGQDVRVEAGVVPCDGTRHRVVVGVSPFEGAFRANRVATLSVFLGLYDPATDTDSSATDQVNVKLIRG